jgi:hypothetical protein
MRTESLAVALIAHRETDFGRQRLGAKIHAIAPQPSSETARAVFEPAKMPANCGLFVRDQETPVRIGLRGGPERTQTACQARSRIEPVSEIRFDIENWSATQCVCGAESASGPRRMLPA